MRSQRAAGAQARLLGCAAGLALAAAARAEEFAVFKGATDTDDHTSASYSWQLEYRQPLRPHLDLSLAYLNEGHLPGHHRDGGTLQFWLTSSPKWRHVDLALGVGPYFYFDTQTDEGSPGWRNYHGVGEIYTASATYRWDSRWFVRLNLSEIHTPGNVDTRTLVLGVGHSLDPLLEKLTGSLGGGSMELGPFGGQTIDNSATSPRSRSFGVEYRWLASEHLTFSAAWLNESDGTAGSHNGVVGEVWATTPVVSRRVTLGLGAGPYFALQRREDDAGSAFVEAMVSLSLAWRLSPHLVARFTWDRGITSESQDRDLLRFGLAWRWGR